MATSQSFIDFVVDSLAFAGNVRYKKMFGEYMVYINEKPLVLVCDETPFVKKLPCLDTLMNGAECGFPYNGAKEHYILDVENRELAEKVIGELDAATPLPKPKAKKPPKTKAGEPNPEIDEYIAKQPEDVRLLLESIRAAIRHALPDVTEKISWSMPTYWRKENLIHFAAHKSHAGIYPGSEAMEHFATRLADYKTSKGAVQLPYKTFGDEQLALISEIAAWCGKRREITE